MEIRTPIAWLTPALLASALPAQRVVLEWRGLPGERYGAAVAAAGDVDLDGWPDVLIGAPEADGGAGRAELRSGRDGTLLRTWSGSGRAALGGAVDALGDVDRDGRPDLLIASDVETLITTARGVALWRLPAAECSRAAGDGDGDGHADVALARAGTDVVEVVSGRTGATFATFAIPPGMHLADLAHAGDVDADGRDDLVFGAVNGQSGSALVVSPARGIVLWEWASPPASGEELGRAVAGAGDVDGDGHADVAVALSEAPTQASHGGWVRIHSGAKGVVLDERRGFHHSSAVTVYQGYGRALAAGADLDGDGKRELLLHEAYRSPTHLDAIRAWNGALVHRASGPFAGCGDVDRDGFEDVVVGDPDLNRVLVCAGPGRRLVAEIEPPRPLEGQSTTLRGLASLDDVDGDGIRDLLVVRNVWDWHSGNTAYARVHSGRTAARLPGELGGPVGFTPPFALAGVGDLDRDGREDWAVAWLGWSIGVQRSSGGRLVLPSTSGTAGFALAGGPDWNDDGHGDVFVGVPGANATAGAVHVHDGRTGALLVTLPGAGGEFGKSLCVVGDVDGDGVGDLIVAAPSTSAGGTLELLLARGTRVAWTRKAAAHRLVPLSDHDHDGRRDFACLANGSIEVRSSIDGDVLRTLPLPVAEPDAFDGGSDADGDALADFVVTETSTNRLFVLAGSDGRVLSQHVGHPDGFGAEVAWIGDVDGRAQVAGLSRNGGGVHAGIVRVLRDDARSARAASHGHGCRGSEPAPRLHADGWPAIGGEVGLEVAHAAATPGLLVVSAATPGEGWPLLAAGAPACVLWARPDVVTPLHATGRGTAVRWSLPSAPYFAGRELGVQHIALEIGASGPRLLASNALRLRLGW